jgi:hypothetical protein
MTINPMALDFLLSVDVEYCVGVVVPIFEGAESW